MGHGSGLSVQTTQENGYTSRSCAHGPQPQTPRPCQPPGVATAITPPPTAPTVPQLPQPPVVKRGSRGVVSQVQHAVVGVTAMQVGEGGVGAGGGDVRNGVGIRVECALVNRYRRSELTEREPHPNKRTNKHNAEAGSCLQGRKGKRTGRKERYTSRARAEERQKRGRGDEKVLFRGEFGRVSPASRACFHGSWSGGMGSSSSASSTVSGRLLAPWP